MGLAQLNDIVLASSAVTAFKGISSDLVNLKVFGCTVLIVQRLPVFLRKCYVIDSEGLFVYGILEDLGHWDIYVK